MGNIYRYPAVKERDTAEIDGFPNFSYHTNYRDRNLILLDKGINPIARVMLKNEERIPAILISSSPHKVGSDETPGRITLMLREDTFVTQVIIKMPKQSLNPAGGIELFLSSISFTIHQIVQNAPSAPIIFFKEFPKQ